MTWEEDTLVGRIRQLFRSRGDVRPDTDPERRRSNRMRYFLTVFGLTHWGDRVEGRRSPL